MEFQIGHYCGESDYYLYYYERRTRQRLHGVTNETIDLSQSKCSELDFMVMLIPSL